MYYSTLALKHHGFFFIMGEYRHELYFIRGVEMGGGGSHCDKQRVLS